MAWVSAPATGLTADACVAIVPIEVAPPIRRHGAELRQEQGELAVLYGNPVAMIAAADEPDSGIDDRLVAGNVLTMLLAGEDTTANTVAWMIHLLWRNPQALARARPPRRPDARRCRSAPARASARAATWRCSR